MVAENPVRLLLLALLLCGCGMNPRVNLPVYEPPKTRTEAARQLIEALDQGGRGVSETSADESVLRWHERTAISDTRMAILVRELDFRRVRKVPRPRRDGTGWILEVDASGGLVALRFRNDIDAAKAESALIRLQRAN